MEHQQLSTNEIEPTLSSNGQILTLYKNVSIAKEHYVVDDILKDKLWYEKNAKLTTFIIPAGTVLCAGAMVAAKAFRTSFLEVDDKSSYMVNAIIGAYLGAFVGLYISLNIKVNKSENDEKLEILNAIRNRSNRHR